MATVASSPAAAAGQRVILHDVRWQTYESLLADHMDRRVPRFTYDRGALEIVSPSAEHEEDAETLKLLVTLVAAALSIRIRRLGSTTYRREELQRGFESDGSFYVQNEPRLRGRREIDLTIDPPPALVIEVDVSHSSLDKLGLFAAMGVQEVWRCDGQRVIILTRAGDAYRESTASLAIPPVTNAVLTQFLSKSRTADSTDGLAAVNDWARAQRSADSSPPP